MAKMLTAMIAEDELLVRIGIASCVPWNELELMLVGEAEDGDEAWEQYQQYIPDIAIIDIRMPGMNGIELIQKIRSMNHRCEIIVITNVENDETLEAAKKLGVSEIILKATMKKADINAAVTRVLRKLKQRDPSEEGEQSSNVLWADVLFGDEKAEAAPFQVKGLMAVRIFPDKRVSQQLQLSLANLVIHRLGCPDAFAPVSHGSCLFLIWKDSPDKYTSVDILLELARYVHDNFQIKLGIAVVFEALERTIRRTAHIMLDLLHSERMFDRAVLQLDSNGMYRNDRLIALKRRIAREIPLHMNHPEMSKIRHEIDRYPGAVEKGFENIMANSEMLLSLLELKTEFYGFYEMTEKLCQCIELLLDQKRSHVRPEIRKALDYVNDHLADDLSLEYLSKYVNFQSSYFSRIFKMDVHCSYSEYVFYARMICAQDMLTNTDLSISKVAEQCGFTDPSHFSVRFRQFCGMTPRQWREKE